MKVLHLLASGAAGGIESLCKDIAIFSKLDNTFIIVWGKNDCTTLEMKANGSNVIELNASKKKFFNTYKMIKAVCKKEKPDALIIHHSSPILHLYSRMLKSDYPKLIVTAYSHGSADAMCRKSEIKGYRLRKFVLSNSLCKADCVIAISKAVKKSLVDEMNIPENKIHVNYNGTDINKFSQNFHRLSKPVHLIYVGRLIKEKGVQIILQNLAKLPKEITYRFTIVGDGEYRSELEKLVAELGLTNNIEFLGTRRDVPELLKNADIFIHLPVWEEGFGIAIIEAMASGLICICAKSGAIPEIIDNGKNGFIINRNEPEQFSNTLSKILSLSDDQIEILQKAAYDKAKEFSIEHYCNNLDNLLAHCFEGEK